MSIRLMRGDCLKRMEEIEAGSVDLILCDLPYGTTQNKWDAVIPFGPLWTRYRRVLKSSGAVILTSAQPFTAAVVMSNPDEFKVEWVWRKESGTGFLNAKKQPLRNHENVLVFYQTQPIYSPQFTKGKPYTCKQGSVGHNYNPGVEHETVSDGRRYPLTVIDFPRDSPKIHPTQKPVALMEYLIRTYTLPGQTVLDNCMGSGTTGVACVNTRRKFIGIELDPTYFEIAQRRIAEAQENLLRRTA